MSTSRLQVTIDNDLKERVNEKLSLMGLNPSVIINALYLQIDSRNRIPFDFALTNQQSAERKIIELATKLHPNPPTIGAEEYADWYDGKHGDY